MGVISGITRRHRSTYFVVIDFNEVVYNLLTVLVI